MSLCHVRLLSARAAFLPLPSPPPPAPPPSRSNRAGDAGVTKGGAVPVQGRGREGRGGGITAR